MSSLNLKYLLSCPGKIFVIGEYSCIIGHPGLLLTLDPKFMLTAREDLNGNNTNPFHIESPAGKFFEKNRAVFKDLKLEFIDEYTTPIGVGSSSAQFLMLVALWGELTNQKISPEEYLKIYWNLSPPSSLRPSGLDLIAQLMGGPVIIQNEPVQCRKLNGTADEVGFTLAYTGAKQKTHEHLENLAKNGFPKTYQHRLKELSKITENAFSHFEKRDFTELGKDFNAFQSTLNKAGIVPEHYQKKIETIQSFPGVLGCKGSGAQGGDCVLIVHENSARDELVRKLVDLRWSPIDLRLTSAGLEVQKFRAV